MIGDKIKGSNVQKEANFKKKYSGIIDEQTNQVEIRVEYSFGQVAKYTGVLSRKNGEDTTLKFEILEKGKGNSFVGDWGLIRGKTFWNEALN